MTSHDHTHACTTCGRCTATCPGCGQPWPDGQPGYLAAGSWHHGTPSPDTRPRGLVRAEQAATRAEQQHEAARSAWDAAASRAHRARAARAAATRTGLTGDGQLATFSPTDDGEINQLEAAAAEAREQLDRAGRQAVEARRAHAALVHTDQRRRAQAG